MYRLGKVLAKCHRSNCCYNMYQVYIVVSRTTAVGGRLGYRTPGAGYSNSDVVVIDRTANRMQHDRAPQTSVGSRYLGTYPGSSMFNQGSKPQESRKERTYGIISGINATKVAWQPVGQNATKVVIMSSASIMSYHPYHPETNTANKNKRAPYVACVGFHIKSRNVPSKFQTQPSRFECCVKCLLAFTMPSVLLFKCR